MKTFQSPGPTATVIELGVGDIKVNASDRDDCTVSIRPRDEGKQADVHAVEVNLPTGSSLNATTGMGFVHCEGELADTAVKTGMGDIRLDQVGALSAKTALGDVIVDGVAAEFASRKSRQVQSRCAPALATAPGPDASDSTVEVRARTGGGDITINRATAA